MIRWTTQQAITSLRYVLGAVVLWASSQLLWAMIAKMRAATDSGHNGPHVWILLVLASVEIVAAILFLAPVVDGVGSYLLLVVIALAILFHLLQRQFDFGALLVYAMAVMVWLAHRRETQSGARDER
jgi:hypothetical protein